MVLSVRVLVVAVWVAHSACALAQDLRIQRVDTDGYEALGHLRVYFDAPGIDEATRQALKVSDVELSVGGSMVGSDAMESATLRTFGEIGEPVSIYLLFPRSTGFLAQANGEASLFDTARKGVGRLVKGLAKQRARIRLAVYDERGLDVVTGFSENLRGVHGTFEAMVPLKPTDVSTGPALATPARPRLLRHIQEAIRDLAEEGEPNQRRILLVVSDGVDGSPQPMRQAILSSLAESARDDQVVVFAVEAFANKEQDSPRLDSLAHTTGGEFTRTNGSAALEATIAGMAERWNQQYVLDVEAPGLPDGKVTLRLGLRLPSGLIQRDFDPPITLPPTPVPLWRVLLWSGAGMLATVVAVALTWRIHRRRRASRRRLALAFDVGGTATTAGSNSPVPQDLALVMDSLAAHHEVWAEHAHTIASSQWTTPMAARVSAGARASHQAWVEASFGAALAPLSGDARRARVDVLVAITHHETWRILRRDRGLSREEVRDVLLSLVISALSRHGTTGGTVGT